MSMFIWFQMAFLGYIVTADSKNISGLKFTARHSYVEPKQELFVIFNNGSRIARDATTSQ